MSLLRVENLSVHFSLAGKTRGLGAGKASGKADPGPLVRKAVDGVSFEVAPGETLGIVGESGCGKSTLGRGILQLLKPTAGEVFFEGTPLCQGWRRRFGREVWGPTLKELRKQVQMVFQDPQACLDPRMTVGQCIAEPLRAFRVGNKTSRKEAVLRLLDRVGLNPDFQDRFPHEFSGGQRQRVGIARALALEPKLLVCDEPISALDVSIQAQILNLFLSLKDKERLSMVFIAHDLAAVRHIADRVAVMHLGQIVEIGATDDICHRPQHPYTQSLLAAVPRLPGDL